MIPAPFSYLGISIALEMSDFRELDGSVGQYTYFRHYDGRIVQVDRVNELSNSQLQELSDQAKISPDTFMDRISMVRKYLEKKSNGD